MRLIDADALSYNLDSMMAVSPTGYIHGDTVADMIGDMPTIEERKTGKWILRGSSFNLSCPFCKQFFVEPLGSKFNYCPSCGADMRGNDNG